jgi:hypothetical protein
LVADYGRSIEELLDVARARLRRLDPPGAQSAVLDGALLVDIRPQEQRRVEGQVPGALHVERNVLEWRFNPARTPSSRRRRATTCG